MGHASTSCLQAGSSVNSVHAPAYEAIDHTAITATVLVACVLYDATACCQAHELDQAELLSLLDQIGAQLLGDNDNESIANAMHGEHQLRLHLPKEP